MARYGESKGNLPGGSANIVPEDPTGGYGRYTPGMNNGGYQDPMQSFYLRSLLSHSPMVTAQTPGVTDYSQVPAPKQYAYLDKLPAEELLNSEEVMDSAREKNDKEYGNKAAIYAKQRAIKDMTDALVRAVARRDPDDMQQGYSAYLKNLYPRPEYEHYDYATRRMNDAPTNWEIQQEEMTRRIAAPEAQEQIREATHPGWPKDWIDTVDRYKGRWPKDDQTKGSRT